jgi:2-dehydropantoate 2-reductase
MVATKSHLAGPAHVVCKSGFARIRFGGDAPRGPMQTLADALNSGKGVTATLTKDIDADVWRKFVMLASFSAVACLARATIGQVLDDSAAYALLLAAVREAVAVARARGVAVPGDAEELVQSQVRDLPRDGRPSMLEDLEAGRPLELDYLSGAIVRLAEQAGIAVPVHATASRALAMHSGGRR